MILIANRIQQLHAFHVCISPTLVELGLRLSAQMHQSLSELEPSPCCSAGGFIEGPPASAADPPPLQLRLCIFPVFVVFVVASFGRCFAHTVGMGDRRHETQLFEHNVHFVWHARQWLPRMHISCETRACFLRERAFRVRLAPVSSENAHFA